MKCLHLGLAGLVTGMTLSLTLRGAELEPGFVSLFNGRDLSGWVNVNCAPDTFTVRDGVIYSTGLPTGLLRSEQQYENFILELEWRHLQAGGNAGLFVWSAPLTAPGTPFARAIEVQILDGRNSANATSHGDVFAIHGSTMTPDRPHPGGWARCLPSEFRCQPAGQWNHYRVTCNDGTIKLAVNGKEVSGGTGCNYRQGYLCLESEGGPAEFRNLRLKPLPSTHPRPDEIAPLAEPFRPLYTGVNLAGWRAEAGQEDHWQVNDWMLHFDGQGQTLWTEKTFGDFELICDWRWTAKPVKRSLPVILPTGEPALDASGNPQTMEVPDAGDSGIYLRGSEQSQVNIWCWPIGSGEVYGYRTDATLPREVRQAVTPRVNADAPPGRWNRFHITLRGDRLTVVLNGKVVIENARLPDVPRRGPIGLQSHGSPIDFASLLIRELE